MTVADYDLLRQVWRQAHALPEGVRIECPSPQAAVSMRFALYNSVKKYRNEVHAQAADDALVSAIRALSGSIVFRHCDSSRCAHRVVIGVAHCPNCSEVVNPWACRDWGVGLRVGRIPQCGMPMEARNRGVVVRSHFRLL